VVYIYIYIIYYIYNTYIFTTSSAIGGLAEELAELCTREHVASARSEVCMCVCDIGGGGRSAAVPLACNY
jgi:hypothetical protein